MAELPPSFASVGQSLDFVVVSGSLPPGVPEDFYARIAEIARDWAVPVSLDTSGPPLKRAMDHSVDLVKPNLRELREPTGEPLIDEASWITACDRLMTAGKARIVALTLGHRGALLVTRDGVWRADPLPIRPASTVGAGDSFLGAMVWALASGHPVDEAFRYGVAAGSAALLTPGTELCHAADVHQLLDHVVVERTGQTALRKDAQPIVEQT